MLSVTMLVAVKDIAIECAGEPDLMERVRKAMQHARAHWLIADPNARYTAAVAAALLETTEPAERERMERSIALCRAVAETLDGRSVPDAALNHAEDCIPLLGMWLDITGEPV